MRSVLTPGRVVAGLAVAGLLVAACGGDDSSDGGTGGAVSSGNGDAAGDGGDRPTVVVTTTILGDIVANVAGDEAEVEVLLPRGADPHEASLSARQADDMANADLLVTNGAGFEEGMASVLASVEDAGTSVFAFADRVDLLPAGEDDHGDEHEDEGAAADDEHDEDEDEDEPAGDDGAAGAEDDDHEDEDTAAGEDDEHDHEGDDPHLWTDPTRIAAATQELGERIAELDGVDAAAVEANTAEYVAAVEALDGEIEEMLAHLSAERRVLVTNHEVFGYFADRYEFEVVGAVIPSQSTLAEASPAGIEELADAIEREGVPAIFAETTQSTDLAESLADQVGDIEVVTLFTESLGDDGSGAETYLDMMRTNAELIVEALR